MNTNINDIMFPVKAIPAIGKFPKNANYTQEDTKDTGYKFIMREDTGQVLSCVTNTYQLIDNNKIHSASEKVIKAEGGVLKEVQSFSNGARCVVKWQFPKHKVKISKNDICTPEIIWQNSYDMTMGLNIIAGAFRIVCTNGMVIGVIADKYKNKHSIYNMKLNDIEGVIDETIKKTKLIMSNEFPVLYDTNIRDRHIVDILKMFPITSSDYITNLLIAARPKNLWDLINVATNVATHGMDRKAEATHKLESKIYKKVCKMAKIEPANA